MSVGRSYLRQCGKMTPAIVETKRCYWQHFRKSLRICTRATAISSNPFMLLSYFYNCISFLKYVVFRPLGEDTAPLHYRYITATLALQIDPFTFFRYNWPAHRMSSERTAKRKWIFRENLRRQGNYRSPFRVGK
jgi:hypothetical protein